jgi:multiple sugar transport system ATP-binding protein
MSKIILKGIKKKYPNQTDYSVKDFNLEIEEGEFIVLVGPSGCGKSTTLRMIAGLEDITEGEFIIDGEVVNNMSSKERDIAMVFQSYALYPHMDVRENIGYGLKLRKELKDEIANKVDKVSNDLGLVEYLDRKPKDLSGGQRQRVALGRAMVRTPKLYLMDEPLSNLDAKLRTVTRGEIARLHRQKGVITIYVTHDQVEAMTMASRIVVMSMGEVQQIGTPKELYNNPKNVFVATFMGQPSMNIIKGVYDGETFKCDSFSIELVIGDRKILDEKGYIGKEILIGVRQQNIRDEEIYKQTFSHAVFKAVPTNVEYLGDHVSAFFEIGEGNLVASKLSSNSDVMVDVEHEFVIEATKLYLFDADTSDSIIYESNELNVRKY